MMFSIATSLLAHETVGHLDCVRGLLPVSYAVPVQECKALRAHQI